MIVERAFNYVVGGLALVGYIHTYGSNLWSSMIDACTLFETSGGVVTGINCVAQAIFYMFSATMIWYGFGSSGQAAAEYITTSGITPWGKRSEDTNGTWEGSWKWEAVHNRPEGLYDFLGQGLPGDQHLIEYNVSETMLPNSVAIVKEDSGHFYVHASNVSHGVVSRLEKASSNSTLDRRQFTWNFGAYAGMKLSYANPSCTQGSLSDQTFDDNLGQLTYTLAQYMQGYGGDSYAVIMENQNDYGTPYFGGYLIAESQGFGTNFEGAPTLPDCFV